MSETTDFQRRGSPGMVKHFLDEVKFGLGLKFNSGKGTLRVSVGMACVETEGEKT